MFHIAKTNYYIYITESVGDLPLFKEEYHYSPDERLAYRYACLLSHIYNLPIKADYVFPNAHSVREQKPILENGIKSR